MAKRRKKRKSVKRKKARKSPKRRKKSRGKNAWSAAKERAYKRARRKLINAFKKKGTHGKIELTIN